VERNLDVKGGRRSGGACGRSALVVHPPHSVGVARGGMCGAGGAGGPALAFCYAIDDEEGGDDLEYECKL
jgi:hypothetical protein